MTQDPPNSPAPHKHNHALASPKALIDTPDPTDIQRKAASEVIGVMPKGESQNAKVGVHRFEIEVFERDLADGARHTCFLIGASFEAPGVDSDWVFVDLKWNSPGRLTVERIGADEASRSAFLRRWILMHDPNLKSQHTGHHLAYGLTGGGALRRGAVMAARYLQTRFFRWRSKFWTQGVQSISAAEMMVWRDAQKGLKAPLCVESKGFIETMRDELAPFAASHSMGLPAMAWTRLWQTLVMFMIDPIRNYQNDTTGGLSEPCDAAAFQPPASFTLDPARVPMQGTRLIQESQNDLELLVPSMDAEAGEAPEAAKVWTKMDERFRRHDTTQAPSWMD